MSTRKTPGIEDGLRVRVTTLSLHSAESRDDPGALTSWNPKSLFRLVAENFTFTFLMTKMHGTQNVKVRNGIFQVLA
jgi:hypothetical protein